MHENFESAVQFAKEEIQGFYDRGNNYKALNQKGRSEILEVLADDFAWKEVLKHAGDNYHAFDSLRRYCAHLIRAEKSLPPQLKHWLADVLEGIQPTLKQPRGGVLTGEENNFFIARLVEKVAVKFGLERTRNEATEVHDSACDAVHLAIINVPQATDIGKRQFRSIKKAYEEAKKRGIFMGN